MAGVDSQEKKAVFAEALKGKRLPILTLDNKWYRLLNEMGKETVKELEEQLNALLKRQGKLNTETKEIKKQKKTLMNEIVPMVDEMEQKGSNSLKKKIAEHKKKIEECNEKLDSYQDELMELPKKIDHVNLELMKITMEYCYEAMQENDEEIKKLAQWVAKVRVELKKNLVRKQQMEQQNQDIYSYMHDIFGPEVVDIFDMQYNPEQQNQNKEKAADKEKAAGKENAADKEKTAGQEKAAGKENAADKEKTADKENAADKEKTADKESSGPGESNG